MQNSTQVSRLKHVYVSAVFLPPDIPFVSLPPSLPASRWPSAALSGEGNQLMLRPHSYDEKGNHPVTVRRYTGALWILRGTADTADRRGHRATVVGRGIRVR